MTEEHRPPIEERLGRTGMAAVIVATVVVLVAPIVSFFFAGSRMDDGIEWGRFIRIGAVTWVSISVATVIVVTLWLWLGWESPEADTMEGDEET